MVYLLTTLKIFHTLSFNFDQINARPNLFLPNILFWIHKKASENVWFCDVATGEQQGTLWSSGSKYHLRFCGKSP